MNRRKKAFGYQNQNSQRQQDSRVKPPEMPPQKRGHRQ